MTRGREAATRLATLAAGLTLAALAGAAAAQTEPILPPDDHFLCYHGKPSKGEPSAAGAVLDLVDALAQQADFDVGNERGTCNPAATNGGPIVESQTFLTAYRVKRRREEAKFAKARDLRLVDAFGELRLDLRREHRILTPAAKDDDPTDPLPEPPQAASHDVDSYKCYTAKEAAGTPKWTPRLVTVEDDWEVYDPDKTYRLRKPKLVCLAVAMDGESVKNAAAAMVCYRAKRGEGEPKHRRRRQVGYADQLIRHRLDSRKEEMLCSPALVDPPAQYCGDGVVNQDGLEDCDGDGTACSPGQICTAGCRCLTLAYCGDGTLDPGEVCESNADCLSGSVCTGACTCIDARCPASLTAVGHAKDVLAGIASDYDSGWTGAGHNGGIPDLAQHELTVRSVTGSGPAACGEATIGGIDPTGGMCRCDEHPFDPSAGLQPGEPDNRTYCDQPFQFDADDCDGKMCICYMDPPVPGLIAKVPLCNMARFAADVSGTWNVDTGDGALTMPVEQISKVGDVLFRPCPTCDGDATLNDGIRGGICNGGKDDGLACDANGIDRNFPIGVGGEYSLDCLSDGPTVVQGIFIDHQFSTGSVELDSAVICGAFDEQLCHCGVCAEQVAGRGMPCRSDGDCGTNGPCRKLDATNPLPNGCPEGTTCVEVEPAQGECQGPPGSGNLFCDGVLRYDGTGLMPCTNNAECVPPAVAANLGACTFEEFRRCLPPVIALAGTPSTTDPYVVSASCTGVSSNPAVNLIPGYPGPGVRQARLSLTAHCAGDPTASYPDCP